MNTKETTQVNGEYLFFSEDMRLVYNLGKKLEREMDVLIISDLILSAENDYKILTKHRAVRISKAEYIATVLLNHGLKVGGEKK